MSLVPAGYRNWSEVAAAMAGSTKRESKARAALERERQATLRLGIKAPTPPGGKPPSRRMIRVAANCQRVLAELFAKRVIRDDALYPAGQVRSALSGGMGGGNKRRFAPGSRPCVCAVSCRLVTAGHRDHRDYDDFRSTPRVRALDAPIPRHFNISRA